MCTWRSVHKCVWASAASFISALLKCIGRCHAACKVNIKARGELSRLAQTGWKRGSSRLCSAGAWWMAELTCTCKQLVVTIQRDRANAHGETCACPPRRNWTKLKWWMRVHAHHIPGFLLPAPGGLLWPGGRGVLQGADLTGKVIV